MRRLKWPVAKIEQVLREVATDIDRGMSITASLRKFGVARALYYRWKAKLGMPDSESEQQVKELLAENKRLHRLVSQQALDIAMLREVARGKF